MIHATRHLIAAATLGLFATAGFAMTSAEHKAAEQKISSDYKADKAQCAALAGNAKDVCEKEASGKHKVAKADLQAAYKPSSKAGYNARVARADAAYDVAKEKCDDLSGNPKDVCVKDAKAAHVKGKEEAKVVRAETKPGETVNQKAANVAETKQDAAHETREAQYKAAAERCDALSGDVKEKCVADAKRAFGQ